MANKVSGDDCVLGVFEDALEWAVGGLLDGGFDLIVSGLLLGTDNEIDDGDVDGGDTESKTAAITNIVNSVFSPGQKGMLT